jgi:hypothetical protein
MFDDGKDAEACVVVSIQPVRRRERASPWPSGGVTGRRTGHDRRDRAACSRREKREKYKARTIG